MPIKRVSDRRGHTTSNTIPNPTLAHIQEEIPLPQEPPPIPPDDTTYFVNVSYELPDGEYVGEVIQSKFLPPDARTKLLMVFGLEDGTQFLLSQRLPLNTNTAFGKEMYKQSFKGESKGIIFPECFIGATATFEIVNRTYNDKNYSNIVAIKFAWDFGNHHIDNCEDKGDSDDANQE